MADQFIRITAVNPRGSTVTAMLGDGYPRVGADSGWQVISRARRKGFLDWQGTSPITLEVPVVLDSLATDGSVEHSISTLYAWMRAPIGRSQEPHEVHVRGAIPFGSVTWVIDSIDQTAEDRRVDGARTRAAMTITFKERVEGDVIVRRRPARSAQQRHRQSTSSSQPARTHTVKSGQTLISIAASELGDASRWQEIATLNGIRDPSALQPGMALRLPS